MLWCRQVRQTVLFVLMVMAIRPVMMPMRFGCEMQMRTRVINWLTVFVSVPQRRRRRQQQAREQRNCDQSAKHRLLRECHQHANDTVHKNFEAGERSLLVNQS